MRSPTHSSEAPGLIEEADLCTLGAAELARLIQGRRVSPVAVVEAYAARLTAVNARLNAVVALRLEEARDEAVAAEKRLEERRAPLPPLLGVPFTVKEPIRVAGMPNTAGLAYRRHCRAQVDAACIARLRRAGAIPLGVTNTPEAVLGIETVNMLYGRTRNPYDVRRSPGGSSGGEAAIVAAGGAAFGIGSDLGGSIRGPAFLCGVFGHKPSAGLVPFAGHWPIYDDGERDEELVAAVVARGAGELSAFNTIGPFSRKAEDLWLTLQSLRHPERSEGPPTSRLGSPRCVPLPEDADPHRVDWRGRRVVLLSDPRLALARRATPALRIAAERAAQQLVARGAVVSQAPADLFYQAFGIWAEMGTRTGFGVRAMLEPKGRFHPLGEALRRLAGRPTTSFAALWYALGEFLFSFAPARRTYRDHAAKMFAQLDDIMSDGAVLVLPGGLAPAPRHTLALLSPFEVGLYMPFNLLGAPMTSAPIGLDANGLPLGVQIAAAPGHDHLTISAALALEEALGGYVPPQRFTTPSQRNALPSQ